MNKYARMTRDGTTYGCISKLVHDHSYSVPMMLGENAPGSMGIPYQ